MQFLVALDGELSTYT